MMDRPFFRILVGGIFLVAIFYIASIYFSRIVDDVVEHKYEMLADRFSISMGHIHKQWMLGGKKSQIKMNYQVETDEFIDVNFQLNEFGWPINIVQETNELNCLNLWMYFANDSASQKTVLNLTAQLNVEQSVNECRYYHLADKGLVFMFSYSVETGKVTSAKQIVDVNLD